MILVARDTARVIFDEVQLWVERGLAEGGAPLESIVYPLSALVPAGEPRCSLELLGLDDLRHVVLAGAAVPPDEVKAFSPGNCHFDSRDMEAANARFNDGIAAQLRVSPRLGVHSKLHSHPFAAAPFLSGGDLEHGVTSEKARAWRWRRGLKTALLHLAYPDGEPLHDPRPWRLDRQGAVAGRGRSRVRWRIRSWGSVGDAGQMRDLGDAGVVPQSNPMVRAARRPPYWATRRGASWCDAQKAALRAEGYEQVTRYRFGRGWRRYLMGRGGRVLLIALPPDLPRVPPRVMEVIDAASENYLTLPLPARVARISRLSDLSLPALAAHYLGRGK